MCAPVKDSNTSGKTELELGSEINTLASSIGSDGRQEPKGQGEKRARKSKAKDESTNCNSPQVLLGIKVHQQEKVLEDLQLLNPVLPKGFEEFWIFDGLGWKEEKEGKEEAKKKNRGEALTFLCLLLTVLWFPFTELPTQKQKHLHRRKAASMVLWAVQ